MTVIIDQWSETTYLPRGRRVCHVDGGCDTWTRRARGEQGRRRRRAPRERVIIAPLRIVCAHSVDEVKVDPVDVVEVALHAADEEPEARHEVA